MLLVPTALGNRIPLTLNRGPPPIDTRILFLSVGGYFYLYCQIWVQLGPLRTGRLREACACKTFLEPLKPEAINQKP